jgi:hypothetical protein
VLANLTSDADTVITALANNRTDVGRFVMEARDTAAASANRRTELAGTFHRLPQFLAELEPAMRELGRVADAQTPALRDLNASAGQLQRFFDNLGPFADAQTPALRDLNASSGQLQRFFDDLGPFADASRPSFRSLGDASTLGRQAVQAAKPTVAELRRFAAQTPELGKNLAIVLEDLANRDRAVEKDARAPGGKGWNGLEALLGYVFWQSQAINIFDRNSYILKVAVYDNECAAFHDGQWVKDNPAAAKHCASALGPTQPGINAPDTSNPPGSRARAQADTMQRDARVLNGAHNAAGPPPASAPAAPSAPGAPGKPKPPIDLGSTIDQVLGNLHLPLPDTSGALNQPLQGGANSSPQAAAQLLDYLLGR